MRKAMLTSVPMHYNLYTSLQRYYDEPFLNFSNADEDEDIFFVEFKISNKFRKLHIFIKQQND